MVTPDQSWRLRLQDRKRAERVAEHKDKLLDLFHKAWWARQKRYDERYSHFAKQREQGCGFWYRERLRISHTRCAFGESISDLVRAATSRSMRLLRLPLNVGTYNAVAHAICERINYWEFHRYVKLDHLSHGQRIAFIGPNKCVSVKASHMTVIERWARLRDTQIEQRRTALRAGRAKLDEALTAVREINGAIKAAEAALEKVATDETA